MSGVRGNINNLRRLKKQIAELPKKTAERVATKAAAALTTWVRASYDGGVSVYGDARENAVDLVATNKVRNAIGFVAVGTLVRAVLTQSYARFLIGKYGILPNQDAAMPNSWRTGLDEITKTEVDAVAKETLDAA